MKQSILATALTALLLSGCAEAVPEQTLSERVASDLVARADKQLGVTVSYDSFELNTLTAELNASALGVATQVEQLDAGLNQLLWAEQVRLEGDWLSQQQDNLQLASAAIRNAQLTIAYYGTGQSNLHTVIERVQSRLPVQRAKQNILWQVDEVLLEDVVVNLFDRGRPLLSVRLARLELPQIKAGQTADEWVTSVLGPLLNELIQQTMRGNTDAVTVDMQGLTQFVWREMGAF
ncbi:hypothetical protein [Pseudidiomarina atlantica]|uniref:hypothetical protein n=1 Tax=Pseudidiomarina atlantica TaxID=1517416 RepID=UPI00068A9040|nr:hypothetical protein [Pseudidiomarina atlantica]